MKVIQLNSTCDLGSTGKICFGISKMLTENNIGNWILHAQDDCDYSLGIQYAKQSYVRLQAIKSYIQGNYGFNSKIATQKLLSEMERIQPTVVHIHNIHTHDCNLADLIKYLEKKKIKIIWTFHDCWAITAYCTHFAMAKCDRWKKLCYNCPLIKQKSLIFDQSKTLFLKKKALLGNLDFTITTPSQWLADLVKESFLKDHEIKVINNGISLDIFRPTRGTFKSVYHLEKKKIVLGVANAWGKRKGLDVFVALSKRLGDDYQIILVGTDDKVDRQLPDSIISIHRTQKQQELAKIYTAADVFVNPTREETFGMVNIEALSCGTPVVTFRTGGSPECVDSTCGSVVDCDNIAALEQEIVRVCTKRPYSEEACRRRSLAFDEKQVFRNYMMLYQ